MNGSHFEIGTIQAFLDGETTPDVSLRLTDHVASCDACARLLATAEEESSFVFSALERELNTLVPTQRLWTRINEGIATEHSRTTVWQKIFVYIQISLANPSITVGAGIILVAGMLAIIWMPKGDPLVVDNTSAGGSNRQDVPTTVASPGVSNPTSAADPILASAVKDNPNANGLKYVRESKLPAHKIRPMTADYRLPADGYLPGEESYVKTIADLKESVDTQKDTVLTPSTRVSYERDMAVVNDSIQRMRDVVKKNPRNQAARQVLYSSYQDKIDLLNSVAQREELMANLR